MGFGPPRQVKRALRGPFLLKLIRVDSCHSQVAGKNIGVAMVILVIECRLANPQVEDTQVVKG